MTRTNVLVTSLLSLLLSLALVAGCSDDSGTTPDQAVPDIGVIDQMPEPDGEPTPDAIPDMPVPDMPVTNPEAGPDMPVNEAGPDMVVEGGVDIALTEGGTDAPVGPPHGNCATPKVLTLTGGTVTESGDTTGLANNQWGNDIKCDTSIGYDGPQLYYQVSLTGGKHYKVTVTPTGWDGAAYAFKATTTCDMTAINTACTGYVSDNSGSGTAESFLLSPTANEDWIIAVDGWTSSAEGPFTLKVEEVTVPANSACAAAQAVTFTTGKATVNGDTVLAPNEFGTDIKCGGTSAMSGNQLYYEVNVPAGQALKLTLAPQFSAYLVVFTKGANCDKAVIETDCASGASGAKFGSVSSGSPESFLFNPATAGDFIVAVDSTSSSGAFQLDFELITPPANATCSGATAVTFASNAYNTSGDTTDAPNEYGQQITCGSTVYDYDGRQVYYTFTLPAGKVLKWTLTPKFDAELIIFSKTCTVANINADCASPGTGKGTLESVNANSTESGYFNPGAAGDFVIAVDAYATDEFGGFDLALELMDKPANDTCATAKTLTLAAGTVTENGTTALSANEFGTTIKCGKTSALDGPQLYYKVNLASGTNYKVSVTPTGFDAVLYAFPSSTGCTDTAIDTACAATIADNDGTGDTEAILIQPTATADWTIVVDSTSSSGDFVLKVEEVTAAANATCAAAQTVTLAAGKATVNGDTVLATDEFATLACGSSSLTFNGNQVYYKVAVGAGKALKMTLTPEFDADLVVFAEGANCQQTAIETDCASTGATGDYFPISSNTTSAVVLNPTAAGNYLIAVDASQPEDWGAFKLDLEELSPPSNDTCATAEPLTFAGNTVTVTSDTTLATDAVQLTSSGCTGFSSPGFDVFYSVQLAAGTQYTVKLTPTAPYDPMLYVFTDCTSPESTCQTGWGSDNWGGAVVETVTVTPTTAGTFYIAVDSYDSTEFGGYTLEVTK